MTEPPQTTAEAAMCDYVDLWNGDFSELDAATESAVVCDSVVPGGEVEGRDAIDAFMRGVHEGYPDAHFTVEELLIDGSVAMYEWTATGEDEVQERLEDAARGGSRRRGPDLPRVARVRSRARTFPGDDRYRGPLGSSCRGFPPHRTSRRGAVP